MAKNWVNYSEIPLDLYAKNVYTHLQKNVEIFPERVKTLLPFMVEYNWLVGYASLEGIERVLNGMNKRTKGISQMNLAIEDLKLHYNELEEDFTLFFEDILKFTEEKTIELLDT